MYPTNNLRAWRLHRGLSQVAVGQAVGTTGAVISLFEHGARRLSHGWLKQFARVYETTPGTILDFAPEDVDEDILRAAMKVPLERQADGTALLKWLSSGSVRLTAGET